VREPLYGHPWYTALTVHILPEVYCFLETFIKYLKNALNLKVLLSISSGYFQFLMEIPVNQSPSVLI
jgi:hypothetical protein